jgi:hypothetical protein
MIRRRAFEGSICIRLDYIRFKPVNDIASVTTVIVDIRMCS